MSAYIQIQASVSCDLKGCDTVEQYSQPTGTDSKKINLVGIARNNKWYVGTHEGSDLYVCPSCVKAAEAARTAYAKKTGRSVNKLRTVFILKKGIAYLTYDQSLGEVGKHTSPKDRVVNIDTGIFYFANRQ